MVEVLGISDPAIILGYSMSFILALICVAYGIKNWNNNT